MQSITLLYVLICSVCSVLYFSQTKPNNCVVHTFKHANALPAVHSSSITCQCSPCQMADIVVTKGKFTDICHLVRTQTVKLLNKLTLKKYLLLLVFQHPGLVNVADTKSLVLYPLKSNTQILRIRRVPSHKLSKLCAPALPISFSFRCPPATSSPVTGTAEQRTPPAALGLPPGPPPELPQGLPQ